MKNFLTGLAASALLALAFACSSDDEPAPPPPPSVSGVVVQGKVQTMNVGDRRTLTAFVVPVDATNRSVTWSTSDDKKATVSGSGDTATVTAVAPSGPNGVTITARTADGGFTDVCNIIIDDGLVHVASVALDKAVLAIVPNGTSQLVATVLPADAANREIEWESSNPAVAAVTPAGNGVAWVKVGGTAGTSATITATAKDGNVVSTCIVNVENYIVPLRGIALAKTSMKLYSKSFDGLATIVTTPANAGLPAVTWRSNNESVATVTGTGATATIKGRGPGYATISALTTSATGDTLVAACEVNVLEGMPYQVQTYASCYYHTIGIRQTGKLWGWGWNDSDGRLGVGNNTEYYANPTQVAASTTALAALDWKCISTGHTAISGSYNHYSMGVTTSGALYAWGYNANGRLGNGSTSGNQSAPVRIGTANDWQMVSCGATHALGIKNGGELWAWGNAANGKLGNNSTSGNVSAPVRIGTATNWRAVAASLNHSVGLREDNTLWTWGSRANGILGDGNTSGNTTTPTQVGTDTDWCYISSFCLGNYTLAIKTNGALYAFGAGNFYVLGTGTNTTQTRPIRVGTANDWHCVAASYNHSAGLRSGNLYTWGTNDGELGTGSSGDIVATPGQIGSEIWGHVAVGVARTIALTADGTAYMTGDLGQFTTTGPTSTTFVPYSGTGWMIP